LESLQHVVLLPSVSTLPLAWAKAAHLPALFQYSLTNSRSEREKLGDEQTYTSLPSPKSAVTGNRNTVRNASFEDDEIVLLFGTSDESDRNVKNRVRADKKPESGRNNDQKSAKGKSADQSEKTRQSSRKQAVS